MQSQPSHLYFNPRSREGSDIFRGRLHPGYFSFQSTLPRGERPRASRHFAVGSSISIHAPARGATKTFVRFYTYCTTFQSTLPRGERHDTCFLTLLKFQFQSTLPRGERLGFVFLVPARIAISIHAPARGATATDQLSHNVCNISIHAPARGATVKHYSASCTIDISIHAPARGATHYCKETYKILCNFNPRSREGSDLLPSLSFLRQFDFNPRSREGSDYSQRTETCNFRHFNPRSREGSDLYFGQKSHSRDTFQSTLPRGERHGNRWQTKF